VDTLPFAIAAIVGWFLGWFALSRLVQWLLIVVSASARNRSGHRNATAIIAAALMADGLWVLAILGSIAFYFRHAPWLPWALGAAAANFVLMMVLSARAIRAKLAERSKEKNAA
jgi:hypothetical protein